MGKNTQYCVKENLMWVKDNYLMVAAYICVIAALLIPFLWLAQHTWQYAVEVAFFAAVAVILWKIKEVLALLAVICHVFT